MGRLLIVLLQPNPPKTTINHVIGAGKKVRQGAAAVYEEEEETKTEEAKAHEAEEDQVDTQEEANA